MDSAPWSIATASAVTTTTTNTMPSFYAGFSLFPTTVHVFVCLSFLCISLQDIRKSYMFKLNK